MAVITSIKPQKNKRRVDIYLNGKFGFGIDLENFMRLRLKVEQELSAGEIKEILKKVEFQKTLNKLLRFVTLRPRSEREITDWLRRKRVHKSIHKALFNRLKHLKLINDKKFAKWWVEQRLEFKSKSTRELEYELRMKGIDRKIIEEVLSRAKIDEAKMAKEIIKKRKYKWEKLDKLEARKKMGEFLARKGFKWEVIKRTIDDFLKKG